MNRTTPHYQVTETNKDFPNWSVKILSGDFEGIDFVVDRIGIPEEVTDNDTPVRVEIEYTLLKGEVPEGDGVRFTQTVGWIIEDIIA